CPRNGCAATRAKTITAIDSRDRAPHCREVHLSVVDNVIVRRLRVPCPRIPNRNQRPFTARPPAAQLSPALTGYHDPPPNSTSAASNRRAPVTSGEHDSVNSDYDAGYAQFARMVGEENIEKLAARLEGVCPDFAKEVFSVVGGRIWTRGGIDLK